MFSKISPSKTTRRFILTGLISTFFTTTLLFTITLFFANSLWAQNSTSVQPATDNANTAKSASRNSQSPLDKTIAEFQKVWLNIDDQKELAFYLNETSGKSHGGVLLIPNLNQHPASYGLINNLRHSLANNHWHTLAVNMSGAEPRLAMKIIDAGVAYLNSQGIYNIALLGEGAGAAQALHYAAMLPPINPAENKFNKIRAVLLINANKHLPSSSNDTDTLATFSKIKLPIFDAYASSNYQQKKRAEARSRAAQRDITTPYQQVRLPQVADFRLNGDNRITKRIRGWLDQNVAGFMVGK